MKSWKRLSRVVTLALVIAMLTTSAFCVQAEEYDPYGRYDETITISFGRCTSANPKLPEGDTYENNAYFDWVLERLNVQCTDYFEASGDEYTRQVSLAIASEDLPDVMCVYNQSDVRELAENDMIADLTDVYNNYATDYIKELYDAYDGRAFASSMYEDRLVALPSLMPEVCNMVWVRQDWVDQLELTVDADEDSIISRDEIEMLAKAFMEANPAGVSDPVGIALSATFTGDGTLSPLMLFNSFGAYPGRWLVDEDGKAYEGSVAAENKDALEYLAYLYKEGILDPQFGVNDDINAYLTSGRTGIAFGVWYLPDTIFNQVKTLDPAAEFTPYCVDNGTGKTTFVHSNVVTRYIVVSKNCEHPEAVIKIMNMFYDEKVNSDIAETAPNTAERVNEYSRLGVDGGVRPLNMEILHPNNFIIQQYQPGIDCLEGTKTLEDLPEGTQYTSAQKILAYAADPENAEMTYWSFWNSRVKGIGLLDKMNKADAFDEVSPIFPNNTKTMNSNLADMEKLRDETFVKIIVGEASVDDFDSFVEEWNKRGGTQISEEIVP